MLFKIGKTWYKVTIKKKRRHNPDDKPLPEGMGRDAKGRLYIKVPREEFILFKADPEKYYESERKNTHLWMREEYNKLGDAKKNDVDKTLKKLEKMLPVLSSREAKGVRALLSLWKSRDKGDKYDVVLSLPGLLMSLSR
jgi:hypothetical protein